MPAHTPQAPHDEWHSHTVVLSTKGPLTIVGRWESVVDEQVQLLGVALHEHDVGDETREEWIARLQKFGVPVQHAHWSLPRAEVTAIVPLRDA